ncbi:energy-coupling factor transport system substrate-specific component [Tumebacillus sp. BK434]|uniref:ECF transporter S component n=1 Tax=Tumebacillus sp. BK434 TaxID=2512169 RepID=UPI0010EAA71F|nr:ECF transporter S component [Tumebacillus sp. BK434]TCP55703.1 energy-coupling factor transport system substrate-specific component [Tumebacillus sp. BK434]
MKNSYVVNFREIMITVILAVLCGFIYIAWAPLYGVMDGIYPGLGEIVYGTWFIAGVLAAYIVQKPGVAFIAEVAAASGEFIMGGPYGLSTLLYGVAQGAATELVFALFRYRNFHVSTLMIGAAAAALASLGYDALTGGLAELSTAPMLMKIIIRTVSGAILGGLLAKIIVDALAKTGALNNYAIIRKKMEKPF